MDGVDVQQHGQAANHDDNCRVTAAGAGAALTSGRVYFLHHIPFAADHVILSTDAILAQRLNSESLMLRSEGECCIYVFS